MLETSALKLFTVASLCFKLNSVDDTKLPTYRVPVSNERCALILFRYLWSAVVSWGGSLLSSKMVEELTV